VAVRISEHSLRRSSPSKTSSHESGSDARPMLSPEQRELLVIPRDRYGMLARMVQNLSCATIQVSGRKYLIPKHTEPTQCELGDCHWASLLFATPALFRALLRYVLLYVLSSASANRKRRPTPSASFAESASGPWPRARTYLSP
jgi:hypothetical protein